MRAAEERTGEQWSPNTPENTNTNTCGGELWKREQWNRGHKIHLKIPIPIGP